MLVITYEYRFHDEDVKVSRSLPRASWIESNVEFMSKTDALQVLAAARDRRVAFHEERTVIPKQSNSYHSSLPGTDALPAASDKKRSQYNPPHSSLPGTDALPAVSDKKERSQNNSHHTSLPGTDALPAATKDQKMGSDEKGKGRPQNNSHPSSLLGTVFVPAGAKDQKTASHKKKKKSQPRSNSSSYISQGYRGGNSYDGNDFEYGMCDKDCGWCGQCSNGVDYDLIQNF
jgi:hypothetical protein